MNNSEICLLYSSYNNYNMLNDEVIPRAKFKNQLVINVDDFSNNYDWCDKSNFIFDITGIVS